MVLVPWSSAKQPYRLILLNKRLAFMLSVGWNEKDRVRGYIMADEINVLFALLTGSWRNDSEELHYSVCSCEPLMSLRNMFTP